MVVRFTRQVTCASACSPRLKVSRATVWLLALLVALPVFANPQVEELLAADTPPDGIVFEIVEGDEEALATLLPRLNEIIERLRDRFPDIDLAIVSHGGEQFALQHKYRHEYAPIHTEVKSLVDDSVPVHVCGTHAGWYGVTPEDFPGYVDVSPSGPAQIRQYEALGFTKIIISGND